MELKYKNFINDPINYFKDDKEISLEETEYFLSDVNLTPDQDLVCQLLDKLEAFIIPYDINEENVVIRYMYFKIENNNRYYVSFLFDQDGKLETNVEQQLRIEGIKLSKKWKEFYVTKGFTLMTRSQILKIHK